VRLKESRGPGKRFGRGQLHARKTIEVARWPVKRGGGEERTAVFTRPGKGQAVLETQNLKSGLGGEILGKRIIGALFVPEDADDPPTLAIIEELKAVNAAGEGGFARVVAGFVAAEGLSDVAEGFDAAMDGRFEKTVLEEVSAAAGDVVLDGVGMNANGAVGGLAGGGEMRAGKEERAEAIPVALAGRAGDHGVESDEDMIDGVDVFGFSGGSASKRIGAGLLRRADCALLLRGGWTRCRLRGGRLREGESCGNSCGQTEKSGLHGEFPRVILVRELRFFDLDAGTIYQESDSTGKIGEATSGGNGRRARGGRKIPR
jgi:hypothetical protein